MRTSQTTIAIVVSLVGLLFPIDTKAQGACNELLRHGLYDYVRAHSFSASANHIKNAICESYSKLTKGKANLNSGGSYEVIAGYLDLSKESLEQIGSMMCKETVSDDVAKHITDSNIAYIDRNAIDAWRECTADYKQGLRVATTFAEEDQSSIGFSAQYVIEDDVQHKTKIGKIIIKPDASFHCFGPLWDNGQSGPGLLGQGKLQMQCIRNISTAPFKSAKGQLVFAEAATIVVPTRAGDITRYVPAIFVPPPVSETHIKESISAGTPFTVTFSKMTMGYPRPEGRGDFRGNLFPGTSIVGRYTDVGNVRRWNTTGVVYDETTSPAAWHYASFRCGPKGLEYMRCSDESPANDELLLFGVTFRFDPAGWVYYKPSDKEYTVGYVMVPPPGDNSIDLIQEDGTKWRPWNLLPSDQINQ